MSAHYLRYSLCTDKIVYPFTMNSSAGDKDAISMRGGVTISLKRLKAVSGFATTQHKCLGLTINRCIVALNYLHIKRWKVDGIYVAFSRISNSSNLFKFPPKNENSFDYLYDLKRDQRMVKWAIKNLRQADNSLLSIPEWLNNTISDKNYLKRKASTSEISEPVSKPKAAKLPVSKPKVTNTPKHPKPNVKKTSVSKPSTEKTSASEANIKKTPVSKPKVAKKSASKPTKENISTSETKGAKKSTTSMLSAIDANYGIVDDILNCMDADMALFDTKDIAVQPATPIPISTQVPVLPSTPVPIFPCIAVAPSVSPPPSSAASLLHSSALPINALTSTSLSTTSSTQLLQAATFQGCTWGSNSCAFDSAVTGFKHIRDVTRDSNKHLLLIGQSVFTNSMRMLAAAQSCNQIKNQILPELHQLDPQNIPQSFGRFMSIKSVFESSINPLRQIRKLIKCVTCPITMSPNAAALKGSIPDANNTFLGFADFILQAFESIRPTKSCPTCSTLQPYLKALAKDTVFFIYDVNYLPHTKSIWETLNLDEPVPVPCFDHNDTLCNQDFNL
ncbi:hypothetical protein HDU77_000546, partial [Chytriomyces hyalinus]